MRYPHQDGVGARIKKQLVALGYKTAKGGPDIGRFIRERGYDGRYFYRWANKDVTPAEPYLTRLCADLGLSPAYLVFGEDGSRKPKRRATYPIAGGSADAGTAAGVELAQDITPYRKFRDWLDSLWAPALQPQWSTA